MPIDQATVLHVVTIVLAVLGGFIVCLFGFLGFASVGDAITNRFTRNYRFIKLFVTQEAVTAQLKSQALCLKDLFARQDRLKSMGLSYEKREAEDARIRDEIASAKKKFWKSVDLAHGFGFNVPDTIENAISGISIMRDGN